MALNRLWLVGLVLLVACNLAPKSNVSSTQSGTLRDITADEAKQIVLNDIGTQDAYRVLTMLPPSRRDAFSGKINPGDTFSLGDALVMHSLISFTDQMLSDFKAKVRPVEEANVQANPGRAQISFETLVERRVQSRVIELQLDQSDKYIIPVMVRDQEVGWITIPTKGYIQAKGSINVGMWGFSPGTLLNVQEAQAMLEQHNLASSNTQTSFLTNYGFGREHPYWNFGGLGVDAVTGKVVRVETKGQAGTFDIRPLKGSVLKATVDGQSLEASIQESNRVNLQSAGKPQNVYYSPRFALPITLVEVR